MYSQSIAIHDVVKVLYERQEKKGKGKNSYYGKTIAIITDSGEITLTLFPAKQNKFEEKNVKCAVIGV